MDGIFKTYLNENRGYQRLEDPELRTRDPNSFVIKQIKVLFYILVFIIGIFLIESMNILSKYRKKSVDTNFYENLLELNPHEPSHKLNCTDNDFILEIIENDYFYIVKNYIKGSKYFRCNESITLTTVGEYTHLKNLISLIDKWRAPISVTVYGPGKDLMGALYVIYYLRNCNIQKKLIRELVSFHIFFDVKDESLTSILTLYETLEMSLRCEDTLKYLEHTQSDTFRYDKLMNFPANMARNIARAPAMTHFIFSSNIEFLPSPNFVPQFLNMIENNEEGKLLRGNNAFVLPIFEIVPNVTIPDTKQEFVQLYNEQKIFTFHNSICAECHTIPELDRWLNDTADEMHITAVSKRHGDFYHWIPFFIGTNDDPLLDERLISEGAADKMPQAYAMCLLDYDFHILSNAFVTHRNGIKRSKETAAMCLQASIDFVEDVIVPELNVNYGNRTECLNN